MPPEHPQELSTGGISADMFRRIGQLITRECGIQMPPQKKGMLEARLRKRLRELGFDSFESYGRFLFSPEGNASELVHLLDAVTTNKTDFFRESAHFDLLLGHVLPRLVDPPGELRRPLRFWSAGCSSGEEPYTLAMVLAEFGESRPGFDFQILGTDLSTRMLETARLAIYSKQQVEPIPDPLKRKYLLRSRDGAPERFRVVPALRAKVSFRRLNFMDDDYALGETFDVLFCRNVLIYFDRGNQQLILRRLCRYLPSGRYLFTGHSETLNGFELPLAAIAPAVHRRL